MHDRLTDPLTSATEATSAQRPRRVALRRRLWAGLALVLVAWAVSVAWLFGTAWYRVPGFTTAADTAAIADASARILGPAGYESVISTHARPYVYTLDTPDGGRVTVFGAEHTRAPDDPQIARIETEWRALRPTVALVESDLGILFPAFMDPVRTFGEVGAVHALARAADIPTYSWEPPDEVVIAGALAQGFTSEQVALRWVLGPSFSQRRFGRPEDPEAFVRDTLAERSAVPGIEGVLPTIDAIEIAWLRAFPEGPDWRDVSDEFGLPGFLGEIDLNRPRDEHLVAVVAELLAAGERVFVVAGSSHAVKIEPALRALVR